MVFEAAQSFERLSICRAKADGGSTCPRGDHNLAVICNPISQSFRDPVIGLSDVVNKNTGCPIKFKFQINNETF